MVGVWGERNILAIRDESLFCFCPSSLMCNSWDWWSIRTAVPGYKLLMDCKVRESFVLQEEVPSAMQPPYPHDFVCHHLPCVSPWAHWWELFVLGEMSLKVKLIVVVSLLLLVCCTHGDLISVLSYSYLFTILLWCFKNSFWLSSLWCCLGHHCLFLMSSDPLLGLRTEMWHGWHWLSFILSKGRLKSWFDVCFVSNIPIPWWECGFFLFFCKEMFCFATLCRHVKSSLWKPSEGAGYVCVVSCSL